MVKKVVLAYSGGLDTSVITHWLSQQQYAVYCLYIDLGQQAEDPQEIHAKGMQAGAKEVVVLDCQDEFVTQYVLPCVQMNAVYEGTYLLGTAMARPLIAKKQIEWANQLHASAVAHGATGKGNDQVRFEMGYFCLQPNIEVIAPWKDPAFYQAYPGRQEMIEYAHKHSIAVKATPKKPWSSDENLMHISYEAGMLEDPWQKPRADMFERSTDPQQAPDQAVEVCITFLNGVWTAINDEPGTPTEILIKLNKIAGDNGVGRLDLVESRYVGMKSRGVYETPGGTVLHIAHRAIESITLTRDVIELKDSLMTRFASLVYNGYWFTPQFALIQQLITSSQKNVSGQVRLELYKGNVTVTGRRSEKSLYDFDIASMDKDSGRYRPEDSRGFIDLNALPFKIYASQQIKK